MADKPLPTPEELRQLLRYEPETGRLFWRERGPEWFRDGYRTAQGEANNWNVRYAEKPAGYVAVNGYLYVTAPDGRRLLSHRIIYAMHHNEWPMVCDHINGNPLDNRLVNLRSVSQQTNLRNARMWGHNTSGVTGVCWNKRQQTWTASIKVNGVSKFLGNSKDFEECVRLRREAERRYGFSARHGR